MSVLAFIVEDDETLAEIFEQAVSHAGYTTHIISDGQQALDALRQEVPYLIVLDMHLPFVSGEDILKFMGAQERLKDCLVIVTSADASITSRIRDEQTVDFIMEKPVSFVQLRDLAARLHPDNKPASQKKS